MICSYKAGEKMDSNVLHIEGLFYLEKGIYQLLFSEEKYLRFIKAFLREKYSRESRCIGDFFPDGGS